MSFKQPLVWLGYNVMRYRRCLIATRCLLDRSIEHPPLESGLVVGPFGLADVTPLAAFGAEETEKTPERLAAGDRPWGLWKEGELVCYGWSTLQSADFASWWSFHQTGMDVYLYNFFSHPDYRGRGYYTKLLRAICAELADEGLEWAWIATTSHNQASWHGIQKAGFKPAATYTTAMDVISVLKEQPGAPRAPVAPQHRGIHWVI